MEADAAAAVSAGGFGARVFGAGGSWRVGGAVGSASEGGSLDNKAASATTEGEDRAWRREGGWFRVNNSRVEVVVEAKVFWVKTPSSSSEAKSMGTAEAGLGGETKGGGAVDGERGREWGWWRAWTKPV